MSMILKALRIRSTSGITRIVRHLQNGDENELVTFLHGTPDDIRDMHRDAVARGTTYSVRHWIIAPHELMDRAQLQQLIGMFSKEFAFDADRAVVVEHRKPRSVADAASVHWHMLVGEVNPATGHVLRSSFDRVIHELIARVSEYTFGHRFVLGKHTQAVIKGLRRRKLACIADSLEKALLAGKAVPAMTATWPSFTSTSASTGLSCIPSHTAARWTATRLPSWRSSDAINWKARHMPSGVARSCV